ncbi:MULTISPECIES: hypothetical protein [unclassified Streptomyces]|uniref:hypothetical protein n=1 Tax=unclassified Streptomyces TaxID=2593676 RepID=UPI0020249DCF|nr:MULTISPECIES: hypothetical protein [unclassified Streptomyces]MCX4550594.1 hypothetical protein [Streptomyces sp. NBC_01500]WSC22039.1 hypothetical protein OIE60_21425 [Streptomyces sp. NBC_01766]
MRPRPAPQTEPDGGLILHPGTLRSGWCAVCKAWTHITADLLLLSPGGLTTVGTWAWCEICDDPDSPLPPRRIDRG